MNDPTSPRILVSLYGLIACLALLCASCGPIAGPGGQRATPTEARSSAASSLEIDPASPPVITSEAAASPQPAAPLPVRIDGLLDGREGDYSVVVMNPDGDMLYSHRADQQLEAASLYKLGIMAELYRQREAGVLDFSEELVLDPAFFFEDNGEGFEVDEVVPIAALLEQMITLSSNVAAAALLDRVGNWNVNATLADLGLVSTEIRWMPFVDPGPQDEATDDEDSADTVYNVTSAADMGRLFQLLLSHRLVSAEASDEMLDLLSRQLINDRLPAYLPADVVVAHKTGNLDGLIHDAGVIYTPAGPLIVAVLTAGVVETEAVDFIASLAELVYYEGVASRPG